MFYICVHIIVCLFKTLIQLYIQSDSFLFQCKNNLPIDIEKCYNIFIMHSWNCFLASYNIIVRVIDCNYIYICILPYTYSYKTVYCGCRDDVHVILLKNKSTKYQLVHQSNIVRKTDKVEHSKKHRSQQNQKTNYLQSECQHSCVPGLLYHRDSETERRQSITKLF